MLRLLLGFRGGLGRLGWLLGGGGLFCGCAVVAREWEILDVLDLSLYTCIKISKLDDEESELYMKFDFPSSSRKICEFDKNHSQSLSQNTN